MDIRIRAIGRTAGMLAIATIAPVLVIALFQLESETLFELFMCSFIAWMVWVIYSINLSQLESKDAVRQMQERKATMLSNIVNKE